MVLWRQIFKLSILLSSPLTMLGLSSSCLTVAKPNAQECHAMTTRRPAPVLWTMTAQSHLQTRLQTPRMRGCSNALQDHWQIITGN